MRSKLERHGTGGADPGSRSAPRGAQAAPPQGSPSIIPVVAFCRSRNARDLKVAEVLVREGERVEAGQHLMSLEYYKIVTEIVAPTAGIVQHLHVTLEAEVQPGELLIELAPLPS